MNKKKKKIELVNHLGYTSLCRNCGHWICHDIKAWGYISATAPCSCNDYIPTDNLEFLEMKYEAEQTGK